MARAYYNEIDPHAAQWLRNLIAAGHIAPGDVDERSIEDVRPTDLVGYTQCHFFAGIGIWSLALRQAGWPDDRPVWTGSCPCQPFSTAGKGEGTTDERHLWPAWFHLIEHGKDPAVPVLGEQVANGSGLTWLDIVWADMEGAGYTFRAVDLCAAGIGAPHIRQRLFFHADRAVGTMGNTRNPRLEGQPGHGDHGDQPGRIRAGEAGPAAQAGAAGGLADAGHHERGGRDPIRGAEGEHGREAGTGEGAGAVRERPVDDAAVRGPSDGMADADGEGGGAGICHQGPGEERRPEPADDGGDERMANTEDRGRGEQRGEVVAGNVRHPDGGGDTSGRPGPVNGRWAAADWLWCRDQKWRPVESSHVKMVDGITPILVPLRSEDHIDEEDSRARMQALLDTFGEETVQREAGGQWSVQEEAVLRQVVHGELDGGTDEGGEHTQQPKAVGEAGDGVMRELRENRMPSPCTPHRPEPDEQRTVELEDVVRLLPWSLSLAELHGRRGDADQLRLLRQAILQERDVPNPSESLEEAWTSIGEEAQGRIRMDFDASRWRLVAPFPLTDNEPNRTVRLRAYGNGIVAPLATEFIKACMTT